jgi:hypothetical protein
MVVPPFKSKFPSASYPQDSLTLLGQPSALVGVFEGHITWARNRDSEPRKLFAASEEFMVMMVRKREEKKALRIMLFCIVAYGFVVGSFFDFVRSIWNDELAKKSNLRADGGKPKSDGFALFFGTGSWKMLLGHLLCISKIDRNSC